MMRGTGGAAVKTDATYIFAAKWWRMVAPLEASCSQAKEGRTITLDISRYPRIRTSTRIRIKIRTSTV